MTTELLSVGIDIGKDTLHIVGSMMMVATLFGKRSSVCPSWLRSRSCRAVLWAWGRA